MVVYEVSYYDKDEGYIDTYISNMHSAIKFAKTAVIEWEAESATVDKIELARLPHKKLILACLNKERYVEHREQIWNSDYKQEPPDID
jgi:hypothetical protein